MPAGRRASGEKAPESGGSVAPGLINDLAAASRILVAQGVVDGFGHVSMRHPSQPDRYLMARSIAPALVTPDDIIEYDLDSNPCNANGRAAFSSASFTAKSTGRGRISCPSCTAIHRRWSRSGSSA